MSTTFPIEVTVDRLIEFIGRGGTIDAICLAEIGRVPTHTKGDPVGEIMLLMAREGADGPTLQTWLHDQGEAVEFRKPKPVRKAAPLPTPTPRGPLPAFDRDTTDPDSGAPLPVHTTLTQAIPPPGTRRWWRCNSFGVTVPGLPFVPGGATGSA